MSRDDIQKLLGGYATGTLTPEEQQVLFEAALDDQELFDALAREQALRDLLRDPAAKAHLLAALDERPLRWYERLARGWRPLAAAAAMAGVGAIGVVVWRQERSPQPVLVAQVSPPPAANPVSPAAPEPASARPAVESQSPLPQTTVKQAPPPTVARDSNTPADRLAKDGAGTNPVSPEDMREEDRRARMKQAAEAPKRKDLAGSDTEAPPAVKREAVPAAPPPPPPPPRPTLAAGFLEGATTGGVNDARQPQPSADPKAAPLYRSATGNVADGTAGRVAGSGAVGGGGGGRVAAGGAVAGAAGGVSGGVPGAAPPPPPVKAEAQPSQSAQSQPLTSPATPAQAKKSPPVVSQSAPSPSQQGQQGAQTQAPSFPSVQGQQASGRSQFGQARMATPLGATETVQVQASASSLDTVSTADVRSLFYGSSAAGASLGTPSAPGGAAGVGGAAPASSADPRKKVGAQAEKDSAARQALVHALTLNAKAGQAHLPNLGVRYSLLRQIATGGFEYVDPASVKTGDTLELQLMPNDSGTLLVTGRGSDGGWRELMSQRVTALQTYTTRPLISGEMELEVTLTRPPVALTGVALRDHKSAGDVTSRQEPKGYFRQSTTEPATYVVANPASQQLFFTIGLTYK